MSLTVMTFNLRYASDQPPNSWPQRRPVAGAAVRAAAPDIIGTQEGLAAQIRHISADHPEYATIGIGRDSDGGGETATIFYRRERLSAVEQGHFWLSDTPETAGSTGWGNVLPRMTSWARFHDHDTGHELYHVNTHLDHEAADARTRGAALICARVDAFDPGLPVIVTGDFNAISRADPTYEVFLAAGFTDLRFAARDDLGPTYDSYHGYRPPGPGGAHIDWILGRGPLTALSFRLVDTAVGGQYPSDHFPLMVTLELPG
jgi:endonuclease/exonuclease/phosphatase family metal-dependent hydrolase